MNKNLKGVLTGVGLVLVLILGMVLNPFSWNDAGERQVIQTLGGDLNVRFAPTAARSSRLKQERKKSFLATSASVTPRPWPGKIRLLIFITLLFSGRN